MLPSTNEWAKGSTAMNWVSKSCHITLHLQFNIDPRKALQVPALCCPACCCDSRAATNDLCPHYCNARSRQTRQCNVSHTISLLRFSQPV